MKCTVIGIAGGTGSGKSTFTARIKAAFPDKVAVLYLSLIHISEPTRRTPISYAVFCLKKKKHLPAHETGRNLVFRLLLEKKN